MGRSGNHGKRNASVPARSDELLIGVDLDGVVCDQITPAVPLALELHGVELRYEDVTAYAHPIGDSHLGRLLWRAMEDEEFVVSMPSHPGASQMFAELAKLGRVIIVTARPPVCEPWTKQWVADQGLLHHEFVLGEQARKSAAGTDLLIDDYPGNLREFVDGTGGMGILVERPWNIPAAERGVIDDLIAEGRVTIARTLTEVPALVRTLSAELQRERARNAA